MDKRKILFLIFIIAVLTSVGCEFLNSEGDEAKVIRQDNKIFIQDRTGKNWDVTYAVSNYGFVPEDFQFGLGPFAIPPILNPQMLSKGESGYPRNNNDALVIGTSIHGDPRAYPLSVLTSHEVVDERFDSTYVAVAY